MVRGPGQPVRTPAEAGGPGLPVHAQTVAGVQGGGVVFAALTRNSVNCPFTRSLSRGVRAFLFSHSTETEDSGLGRLSDTTELCKLEDEYTLVACSLRRAKRRSRAARALTAACRCSVVRSQHTLHGLSITSQVRQSAHRVWGSVAAMLWLHFPFFWLSDIISNIRQSTIYTQQYYIHVYTT